MFSLALHHRKQPLPLNMSRNLLIVGSACFALLAKALPAPNFIDDESLKCWSSSDAASSAYEVWKSESTVYTSSLALFTSLDTNVPLTTLCDGRPRALITSYTTSTLTIDPPETTTLYNFGHSIYTVPTPSCTIAREACSSFHASYASATSDANTNNAPWPTASPLCKLYRPCNERPDYCFIYGRGGNLYYWPVTTTNGDFCAQNGSTIFASPTSPPLPNTVITDGHTFTSPTNYASFSNIEAHIHSTRHRLFDCGPASYKDVFVPLTETLYSWGSGYATSDSFNFENLNTIPASAYDVQRKCWNDKDCTTIQGPYLPRVPLPTEVLNLEPKEWKEAGCRGRSGVSGDFYMTPVALVTPAPTARGRMG
jgi:hypothetical protein